jgi:hypothetical protein
MVGGLLVVNRVSRSKPGGKHPELVVGIGLLETLAIRVASRKPHPDGGKPPFADLPGQGLGQAHAVPPQFRLNRYHLRE